MIDAINVSIREIGGSKTVKDYINNLDGAGKEKLLHEIGDIMIMAISRYAPRSGVGAQGGKLATTGYWEDIENGIRIKLPDYWPYAEFDTKPHDIVPKEAKALAFPKPGSKTGKIDTAKNNMVFTKKVHHPGTKGQFFIAKSWNRSRGLIETKIKQYAKGDLQ